MVLKTFCYTRMSHNTRRTTMLFLAATIFLVLKKAKTTGAAEIIDQRKHLRTESVVTDGLDWVPTDPKSWYVDSDYCLLQKWHDGGNQDNYEELITKCKGSKDTSTGPVPLGIGLMYEIPKGVLCPPENRPYFKKSLSGFTDSTDSTRLVTAFRKIVKNHQCLLFAGDSVTRQTYYAFLAELSRIDKKITFTRYLHGKDVPMGIFPCTFHERYDMDKGFDRYGGLSTVYFDFGEDHQMAATVWLFHLAESHEVEKAKKLVKHLFTAGCKGVVIISNMGLHLNVEEEGKDQFRKVLTFLNDVAKDKENNTVIWRETSAQHFPDTPLGMYDLLRKEQVDQCKPHKTAGEDWRVTQVKEVWKELKIKDIAYVPFYRATLPLYNMHPDAIHAPNTSVDCTHYCQWPMLWQPIWKGLADAILTPST